MRQNLLNRVRPNAPFEPSRKSTIQENLLHNIRLKGLLVQFNHICNPIGNILRKLKERHIGATIFIGILLNNIRINFKPTFYCKISRSLTQNMRSFAHQRSIGHPKTIPHLAVRIKLRPALTAHRLQWQIPKRIIVILISFPPGNKSIQRFRTFKWYPQNIIRVRNQISKGCRKDGSISN